MDYESQSGGDGSHPPIDPQSTGSMPGEGRVDPMTSGQPGGFGDQPGGYDAPPGAFGGQPGGGQPGSFGSEPGKHMPPPHGGYQPPPEGHAPGTGYTPPPSDQPYGYGPDQGGYQQPSYTPPPKKGGFNWLACCGIGCGVALLVTIIIGVIMWKFASPFVSMGVEAGKVGEDIQKTDLATIQANAEEVDSATLVASPEAYKGKWLTVSGELDDASKAQGGMGQQGTTYVTKEMLIITDVSGAARVGEQGDWITGYGKIVVMDFNKVPWMKKLFEEEAKKNPDQAMPAKIVMLMAKQVEVEGATDDGGTGEPPAAEEPPADAEAPADEGAADASGSEEGGG